MAVKHEIKSQLAKLLATEDLIVEHKRCETAQFNVHTRVLTLPLWERASSGVYDMLVGHEVGHALFTPDEDWQKNSNAPHQYVNIIEDIRIEKMMKRKYPGLSKTFFNGYKELNEQDFFCLEEEDISTFTLPDRINLYAKIGNFIDVEFTEEERELLALCESCSTFADVILAAEELYKYAKKEQEQQTQSIPSGNSQQQSPESSDEGQDDQQQVPESSDGEDNDSEENEGDNSPSIQQQSNGGGHNHDEPEIKTVDQLADKIRDLASAHGSENQYVEIPDIDYKRVIVNNKEIHEHAKDAFIRFQHHEGEYPLYAKVDDEFVAFKKSSTKEVGYLVKEFECKKSADQYARSSTARTGVLDCTKLHQYKYNEDLFRKITVVPDGKNHGLIFILDWSGSMSTVLLDTLKQLYNLMWFCKKVSIPFDVYAFTNEWERPVYDAVTNQYTEVDRTPLHEEIEGDLIVESDFRLLNLFTSSVNGKTLESQMINIWRIAYYFGNRYVGYDIPHRLTLSGTPLNESLVCLHKIIPDFQKRNKVQKVQTVILTDGEAPNLSYYREETFTNWQTREDETAIRPRSVNGDTTFLRDRKTGNNYSIGYKYTGMTDALLYQLRDRFPNTNFIGIRVISPREATRFITMYEGSNKLVETFRKEKSCTITTSGYHAYFALSSTTLAQDSEFDVDDGATKAKIKSAFIKSLKTKKLNKRVLGEFISLVA